MRKALIVRGGWDGHEPVQVSELFADILTQENFDVTISETLDSFLDVKELKKLHLIIPVWTMGTITNEQCDPVAEAVGDGVGLAGCHGGMCDSFRDSVQWQFITGSQWVSHPGGDGVEYKVNIRRTSSPITEGMSDFTVRSEQYYLHVDPAIEVLATTRYPVTNYYHAAAGEVDVPVAYTKRWGHGRVFYSALGHHADVFDDPQAREMMRRGFLWAAQGRDIALEKGLDGNAYKSEEKMY